MEAVNSPNVELVRNHADTIIMNILMEQDRYGYEIIDIITERSRGKYTIKQPTLYNALKRLEKQGFIQSYFGEESNGGRRRYYKLSEKGLKTLTQDQKEWEFSRTILDTLLSDKQIDLETVEPPFETDELRPMTKRIRIPDSQEKQEGNRIIIPITLEAKVEQKTEQKTENPRQVELKAVPFTFFDAKFEQKPEIKKEEPPAPKIIEKERIEDKFLNEKRAEASKILGIGQFSRPYSEPSAAPPKEIIKEVQQPTVAAVFAEALAGVSQKTDITAEFPSYAQKQKYEQPSDASNGNYREAFASIYGNRARQTEEKRDAAGQQISYAAPALNTRQFNDLKQSLLDKGYKLRSYSKPNAANYQNTNRIYKSRLLRDASYLTYLWVIIELLILYLARNVFTVQLNTLLIFGGVSLLTPIGFTIYWATDKNLSKKARFSFKSSMLSAVVLYAFAVIAVVLTYIIMNAVSENSGFDMKKMFASVIFLLFIPSSVGIYNVLYVSKNYHSKN